MDYFSLQELELPRDVWAPFEVHYEPAAYSANQMIYFQESRADYFYYLKAGRVKTFISSEDGTEKVLTIYRAGNLFGEAAFFDELPRVSSAVTLCACDIVRINRQMVSREMAASPDLALAMLKYLARTVRLLSAHVDDMAFLQADQRVARTLLAYHGENDVITCTQEEIASAVSANRVTVSRILKRFQRDGLVETGYGTIRILDRDGLGQIISSL